MTAETKHNLLFFVRSLLSSRFLWFGLVLYGLYWLAVPFVPKEPLLNAMSALVVIGGFAIFATWLPAFVMGIMTGARIGAWQLPVGIFLTWFGLQERGIWTLIWRFAGQPDWMLNNHFTGQAQWTIFLSAFLYLLAPGNENGEVPVKNWWLVGAVLAIASFAAGVVFTALVLQPAA